MKDSIQTENNESKIIWYIKENPGCYLRQIKTTLNISMGTVQHHLYKLEKEGTISSVRSGLHKHFYLDGLFKENEKEIIKYLNQITPRKIIMFIIEKGQPHQTDIAKNVQVSSPSINWNLRKLIDSNIVIEIKDGKFKRYTLNPQIDSNSLSTLFKNYYPSLWDKWNDKLAEIYISFSLDGKLSDKK